MLTIKQLKRRPFVKRLVSELRVNTTPAEREFKRVCDEHGIPAYAQVPFDLGEGRFRVVDFYVPKPWRFCVEIDGSAHDIGDIKLIDVR